MPGRGSSQCKGQEAGEGLACERLLMARSLSEAEDVLGHRRHLWGLVRNLGFISWATGSYWRVVAGGVTWCWQHLCVVWARDPQFVTIIQVGAGDGGPADSLVPPCLLPWLGTGLPNTARPCQGWHCGLRRLAWRETYFFLTVAEEEE